MLAVITGAAISPEDRSFSSDGIVDGGSLLFVRRGIFLARRTNRDTSRVSLNFDGSIFEKYTQNIFVISLWKIQASSFSASIRDSCEMIFANIFDNARASLTAQRYR